jgi:hypothetical protein
MVRVLALVRDRSRAQLLDAPGEIHIIDHRIAGPYHRRATRSPERSDLWRNHWGLGGPLRRSAPGRCVSYSAKKEDPVCRRILARIFHSHRTARQPRIPEDNIRREAGKAFADGLGDTVIKIQLLLGGERMVNAALRQALELQAVILSVKPHKTSTITFWRSRLPPTGRRDTRWSAFWTRGEPGHFQGDCPYGREAQNDDRSRKRDERPPGNKGNSKKIRMVINKQQRWTGRTANHAL